jgi:hypothetical protein
LKKVEFGFPEKVEKILKILVEFGIEEDEIENEEFLLLTKDFFRSYCEEKEREAKLQGISSSSGGVFHTSKRYTASYFEDDDTTHRENAKFYKNEIQSSPNGDYIDKIHLEWFGKWEKLERKHDYIQWLFPIREAGLNGHAQPLTKNEALEFQKDEKMKKRLILSYEMMLDFYGMILVDEKKGTVDRNDAIWEGRIHHLNHSFHNYLRITRILKCLGLCGLEHLKLGWIKFLIQEVFYYYTLDSASESILEYWLPTLRIKSELIEAEKLVQQITGNKVDRKKYSNENESWATAKIEDVEELIEETVETKTNLVIEAPRKYVSKRFLSDEQLEELKKKEEAFEKLKKEREEERRKKYLDQELSFD